MLASNAEYSRPLPRDAVQFVAIQLAAGTSRLPYHGSSVTLVRGVDWLPTGSRNYLRTMRYRFAEFALLGIGIQSICIFKRL